MSLRLCASLSMYIHLIRGLETVREDCSQLCNNNCFVFYAIKEKYYILNALKCHYIRVVSCVTLHSHKFSCKVLNNYWGTMGLNAPLKIF